MQLFISVACFGVAVTMVVLSLAAIRTSRRIVDSWIRVEDALILECYSKSHGIWMWPVVVYEYDAGDVRYIGEDAPAVPTLAIRSEQLSDRYPIGGRIVVYVNPDDHRVSTIAPQRLSWLAVCGILAAVACLTFAVRVGQAN